MAEGAKGVKLARFELLPPEALWAWSEVLGIGAAKYADRNWEQGIPFSKLFGAMQRHAWQFWGGEDTDAEDGQAHLGSVLFHAGAMFTLAQTHPECDDRPRKIELRSKQVG